MQVEEDEPMFSDAELAELACHKTNINEMSEDEYHAALLYTPEEIIGDNEKTFEQEMLELYAKNVAEDGFKEIPSLDYDDAVAAGLIDEDRPPRKYKRFDPDFSDDRYINDINYSRAYHKTREGMDPALFEAIRQKRLRVNLSEDTITRMSESHKGKTQSQETRDKIAASLTGKKKSKVTRKRMSKSHKGRSPSEETRQKMREARKKWQSEKEH